jgi:hypothetical protein
MNGGWSDNTDDLAAGAGACVAAVEAAIAAVEEWGRGQPIADTEASLVRELRTRRAFMEPKRSILRRGGSQTRIGR